MMEDAIMIPNPGVFFNDGKGFFEKMDLHAK